MNKILLVAMLYFPIFVAALMFYSFYGNNEINLIESRFTDLRTARVQQLQVATFASCLNGGLQEKELCDFLEGKLKLMGLTRTKK